MIHLKKLHSQNTQNLDQVSTLPKYIFMHGNLCKTQNVFYETAVIERIQQIQFE